MERFFIAAYRYFKKHRAQMWALLLGTTILFAVMGSQVVFEEDMTKILPSTEKSDKGSLAFSDMKIKDQVILQLVRRDDAEMSEEELAALMDEFVDSLLIRDSSTNYIVSTLYKMQPEWVMNALDFGLEAFPAYLEESAYAEFDQLLTKESIDENMARNVELMEDDMDGNVTMMVTYDPAALRFSMLNQLKELGFGGDDSSQKPGFTFKAGHLMSKDGSVALAFIAPAFGAFDSLHTRQLLALLDDASSEFESLHSDVEVLYHGTPITSAGNSNRIRKDILFSLIVSLTLIMLILLCCYRGKSTAVLAVFPLLYGAVFALAMVWLVKGTMSFIAMGIGTAVLGIAVSYVLHVLTHYKYVGDVETVLREQSTPVCLGCITTIGSFAGLLFTNSDLLFDFGLFAVMALLASTFAALFFMPQFFNESNSAKNETAFRVLEKINSYKLDKCWPLVGALTAFILVGVAFSGKVGFNPDMQSIGYNGERLLRSQKIYSERVNMGYASTYYAATGADLDEALENDRALTEVLDSLQGAGTIRQYSSVLTQIVIPEDKQQENIDRWTSFWTPERVASARKNISHAAEDNGLDAEIFDPFFLLVEGEYYPVSIMDYGVIPEELQNEFMEEVGDQVVIFNSTTMDAKDKKAVGDAVSEVPGAIVADPYYYMSDMVELVHEDFSKVLLISSIFVLLVLLISFRNIITSFIAFLPMFLSWFVVEGIMALTGLEFNLINIVVSSFIFGVGVDYSIFIMDGLLADSRGEGGKLLTYHKTAIFLSAVILISVLCSILFAKSPSIRSVGQCALIGMVTTILISYCLQPLLYRLACRFIPAYERSVKK